MLKEFKEFALKGNVMDMAIGIVIGGAFSTIVKSFVEDIINPIVGLLVGNVNFTNLFLVLKGNADQAGPYLTLEAAKKAGAVTLNYGVLLTNIISFLIVAFSIFILVKAINSARKKENKTAEIPTTKECSYCCSSISIKAKKCPRCCSEVG